jgi:ribosomal protein L11 methyltransferase
LGKAWPALDIHVPSCDPQLQDLVLAELDDFQPTAIQEPDDTSRLRAFFTSAESRDAAARALGTSFGSHLFVESLNVEDEDWAARSQEQLRAVTIGRIVVAPPWDMGSDPLRTIIVKPSMGFGTGHHATTRLMLKALQELTLDNQSVLDVGCGSGVLAVAAVKLGARSAVGIDIDPDALDNARENSGLNEISDRVRFEEGDFRDMAVGANVVMANLTGGLLERSAKALAAMVAPDGFLIVSGFMDTEKAAVVSAFERFLTLQAIAQEEEWMCATYCSGRGEAASGRARLVGDRR